MDDIYLNFYPVQFKDKDESDPNFPEDYQAIDAEFMFNFQTSVANALVEYIKEYWQYFETFYGSKITDMERDLSNFETEINVQLETMVNSKLEEMQQQIDEKIDELAGKISADKIIELENRLKTLEDNALYFDVLEEIEE